MLEPIPFEDSSGINIQKLKLQIDRRVQKIGWMIKRKKNQRKNKPKNSSKSQLYEIFHAAVQTGIEMVQIESKQISLTCSQLKLEASCHTKACSVTGVNTQLANTLISNVIRNMQQSITQSREDYLISPRGSQKTEEAVQTTLLHSTQLQSVNIKQRQKTQESQEQQQQKQEKKLQRICSFGSQDSLDYYSSRKEIEQSRDSKFFSEQNIIDSISIQTQEISQSISKIDISGLSLQKKNKENDASRSKSRNNKNGKRSITPSAVSGSANFLKSTKNFKDQKNGVKQEKKVKFNSDKKKIVTQKVINSAVAFKRTAPLVTKDNMQKPFRSTSFIPRVSNNTKNSSKDTILLTQRKNSERGSKNERNYQKVTVTSETKSKMKQLVRSITPKTRKQGNDGTVRANLLKRIEEKMTINIA